jgi:hypothetical protein
VRDRNLLLLGEGKDLGCGEECFLAILGVTFESKRQRVRRRGQTFKSVCFITRSEADKSGEYESFHLDEKRPSHANTIKVVASGYLVLGRDRRTSRTQRN